MSGCASLGVSSRKCFALEANADDGFRWLSCANLKIEREACEREICTLAAPQAFARRTLMYRPPHVKVTIHVNREVE